MALGEISLPEHGGLNLIHVARSESQPCNKCFREPAYDVDEI